jgi:hypothetical protein
MEKKWIIEKKMVEHRRCAIKVSMKGAREYRPFGPRFHPGISQSTALRPRLLNAAPSALFGIKPNELLSESSTSLPLGGDKGEGRR